MLTRQRRGTIHEGCSPRPGGLPKGIQGHQIHIRGETDCERLSIRPDGPDPVPGQIILIYHGAIQQPQRIQNVEGKIWDNPLRRKIPGKPLGLITSLKECLYSILLLKITSFHVSLIQNSDDMI